MNLWLIFLTGLTSGGVTCAAMQGGFLASAIAAHKKAQAPTAGLGRDDLAPVSAFLAAKLIAHILLGFALGWLGSRVELGLTARLAFQGLAALYMLATAANLLDLHPVFRYIVIQPPRFAYRLLRGSQASLFGPAILGFLTILIPCGVTQAMSVLAITSGSPLQGALILGSFVAGTIPLFMLIGVATSRLTEAWRTHFLRVSAVLLIVMSLYSVNGIATTLDSPYSLTRIYSVLTTPIGSTPTVSSVGGLQRAAISITSSGYTPRRFSVRAGTPVELKVSAGEVYSCASSFTFKAFGINAYVKPNTDQVFTFTPNKKGLYSFACSMGMYSGTMEVI